MATAQMSGRSARLADDAATAALYATHPRRTVSVRDATPRKSPFSSSTHFPRISTLSNIRSLNLDAGLDLSHASAASAIAHANQKSVETWRPGRLPDAERAAWCVKDFTPPVATQPSPQYSAEGLGAAIIAVREQRTMNQSPLQDVSKQNQLQDKARRAATGAYTTRRRADSASSELVRPSDSHYALSAASASHKMKIENDDPLDHLDSAMEASRIRHIANANVQLYTSAPPVAVEVEERNKRNSLRAAAIVMARDMYSPGTESEPRNPAPVYAAKRGQDRLQKRMTISGTEGITAHRAMTLQKAAQKRASVKLAQMRNENVELQEYYGTARPQSPSQRKRLSFRRRTYSAADATHADADTENSRAIRSQMTVLQSRLNQVDDQRVKDREMLMAVAQRNVTQTMQNMEIQIYNDTGRPSQAIQKEWDEAAKERIRQEAQFLENNAVRDRRNQVSIGAQQYMEMADVEAVARSRLQPTLDEITDQAEQRRARDLENRLNAEEKQRQAAIDKEREASLKGAKKKTKDKNKDKEKRMSIMGLKALLMRKKEKRAPKEEIETESVQEDSVWETPPVETPVETPVVEHTATVPEVRVAEATPVMTPAAESPVVQPQELVEETDIYSTPPRDEARLPTNVSLEEILNEEPTAVPSNRMTAARVGAISPSFSDHFSDCQSIGRHTVPRDAAAQGSRISFLHTTKPITSPKSDSKLKTWFRDRLSRRISSPVPLYPHQPGPDFENDSEVGFSGGAALAGRNSFHGHPICLDEKKSQSDASLTSFSPESKRNSKHRLRQSFMKRVSPNPGDEADAAEIPAEVSAGIPADIPADYRRASAVSSSKEFETSIHRGELRDNAVGHGLPAPPLIGETASTKSGRESRFSEDIS
ncbi:hypothetical protein N7495_006073 [Penicillium taxi]|uniref:uncharacterized protein n=1 Tax=Penicillium taxi TaxID=168475 RepID=UPI002545802C|nr:uncharacterized protein N7495_006073 [Penicillium taxi]KAJ5894382.1 hypothetical protein N7495_006073 [Penicillium taxi]